LLCVVAASLVALAVAVPVPYKNCGGAADIIKINSIDASVWPVTRGKPESVSVKLTVGSLISGGTYEFKLTFDGLPLVDKKGNLKDLNISLPIHPGPFQQNVTIAVPSFIPPGTASAHLSIKDQTGKQAVCVNIEVPFKAALLGEEEEWRLEHMPTLIPIPFKNCGKAGDKLTVTKAEASVWPPKVGAPITVALNATLSQDVSGGKYEAKVKFMGLQIIDQKGTIEEVAKQFNLTLPIKAGAYGLYRTETIPAIVPKAPIEVWIQAFNQKGDQIMCLDLEAKLS